MYCKYIHFNFTIFINFFANIIKVLINRNKLHVLLDIKLKPDIINLQKNQTSTSVSQRVKYQRSTTLGCYMI